VDENLSKLESVRPSSRNIFLVPGAGGGAEVYYAMARRLITGNVNVFVLHHDGVDNENEPFDDIVSIAEKYASQVLHHCMGETLIGGYCVGGLIAYELAIALHKRGFSSAKLVFLDTVLPVKNVALPSFDEKSFKSEFFKAICDTYSKTGEEFSARTFDDLSEAACVEYALSKMKLQKQPESDTWRGILRRRYQSEKAHILAMRGYWEPDAGGVIRKARKERAAMNFPLRVIETSETCNSKVPDGMTWEEIGFKGVLVERFEGRHITLLKEHESGIVRSLLACLEQDTCLPASDDLYT
jgi:thioesterase domain-containing protein